MDELTIQTLIRAKYAGVLNESSIYVNLAIQAVAVLIGGLVIWRAMTSYHRKKQQQRKKTVFFETPYSRQWRKK
jgi:hypothetical protein